MNNPDAKPIVSIIIPVYNGSNYLREAIDSALAQTYANIEVLVVNDGSRDGGATKDICLSYGGRIRYFEKNNGGVATALNTAIHEMQGEYFSWLSHDDRYKPEKIEAQISFMARFDLWDAAVYSDIDLIDETGKLIRTVKMPAATPRAMYYKLYLKSFLNGCTLLIPAKALREAGGFPEEYATTQDYELWLKLCRMIPFVYQTGAFVESRQHAEQGSNTLPEFKLEVEQFYRKHLHEILDYAEQFHYLGRKTSAKILEDVLEARIGRKRWSLAWQALTALRRYPGACSSALRGTGKGIAAIIKTRRLKARIRAFFSPIFGGENSAERREAVSRLDFRRIYGSGGFGGGGESASGGGSTMLSTRAIRRELPVMLKKYGINSILDIPCGDFNWMRRVDLGETLYIGSDIVPELIEGNTRDFGSEFRRFALLNLLQDPLPRADAVLCRDCLVHLPNADILKALANIKASGATWLLSTTFIDRDANNDLTNLWRPINLCRPPFNFPPPADCIDEQCWEGGGLFGDKMLGIWRLEEARP